MARNRKRTRDRRPRPPEDGSSLAVTNGEPVEPPGPLSHATPDTELAEAQLALGRPDLAEVPDDAELEELSQGAVHAAPVGAPVRADSIFVRLINFLQGSWNELQRVQWPDRRQVFQATGVVIGFVIVAGVFLGVADVVAQKIVNLILYGHG